MNPEHKNDGGPAFPTTDHKWNSDTKQWEPVGPTGMSLRDWFASQETLSEFDASDGFVPNKLAEALAGPKPSGGWSDNPVELLKWEAKWRSAIKYIRADAMLAAREK